PGKRDAHPLAGARSRRGRGARARAGGPRRLPGCDPGPPASGGAGGGESLMEALGALVLADEDATTRRLVAVYVEYPACGLAGVADLREGDLLTCPRCGSELDGRWP